MNDITVITPAQMEAIITEYKSKCHKQKLYAQKTYKLLTAFEAIALRRFDGHVDHYGDLWKKFSQRKPNPKSEAGTTGANIKKAFRNFIELEQGGRCCYCQRWLFNIAHAKPIEHILPRESFEHYTFHFWNLAVACFDCNHKKSASVWLSADRPTTKHYPSPKEFHMMYHPRFHKFDEHVRFIRVQSNAHSITLYEGITPQGRKLCNDLLQHIASKEVVINSNPDLKSSLDCIDNFEIDPGSQIAEALDSFRNSLADITLGLIKS